MSLLSQEIGKLLTRPDIKETLAQQSIESFGSTPQEFTARIRDDMDLWRKYIKDNNIQME